MPISQVIRNREILLFSITLAATGLALFPQAASAQISATQSTPLHTSSAPQSEVGFNGNTKGKVLGNPANGVKGLQALYGYIKQYRSTHGGQYPTHTADVIEMMPLPPKGLTFDEFMRFPRPLLNPDTQYAESPSSRRTFNYVPYRILATRPDGSLIGRLKSAVTQDVLAYTDIYYHPNSTRDEKRRFVANPAGFYLVLRDDGRVDKVAYDQVLFVPVVQGEFIVAFPNQTSVPSEAVTYSEFWTQLRAVTLPPVGKPVSENGDQPIYDNGGPEGLVAFLRLADIQIEREELWQQFDPSQAQFTLGDIQAGAAKLNLPLQLQKLTLDQLQQRGAPAIFLTQDDKRIVTLANLDAEQAIVLGQGLTRIVARDVLQKRYDGQALISGDAAARSRAQVDDPIRVVPFASTDQEVTQTVNITNRGSEPLSLQIERPIPGVIEATLSAETLAPGQSATLSLKIKWRTILKGDMQNVFVFLHTNDPVQPRLQLGFQLKLPAQAQPAKP